MYSTVQLYQGIDNGPKTFFLTYLISIICHLCLIFGLIVAPRFTSHNRPLRSVIDVSIVSLPEKKIQQEQVRQKKTDPKITSEVLENTTKKSTKIISPVKKRKKIKRSLKKRTYKSALVRKNAIKQIEPKVEQTKSDPLSEAFERLRREVKKAEAGKQDNKESEKNVRVENFNGIAGKKRLELINIYRVEVAYQVQKNWAFSEQLAGGRNDLMAEIAFKIMPDGKIHDIWFDKRSGNVYLDESARKAIMKSNPVRPHPKGINKSYVIVGLRFTPEGIR
ncbi:MAG: cell envelope integrity protein TolA [Deltaproteobacteria bacterium]|nr:cell envelope integrity protein TolA [Deltaproteobacteria bacterium]